MPTEPRAVTVEQPAKTVARLRRYIDPQDLVVGPAMMRDAMIEAADTIEAQAAEIARLKARPAIGEAASAYSVKSCIETYGPNGHAVIAQTMNADAAEYDATIASRDATIADLTAKLREANAELAHYATPENWNPQSSVATVRARIASALPDEPEARAHIATATGGK